MFTLKIQGGRSPPFRPTKGYTDSDYVGSLDNRKLTSGYVFNYGGDAISWRSKLQECTTLLTTKAGYMTASKVAKEAISLHRLSTDFSAKSRINHMAPTLYCDSQSTIHLIKNPVYHAKTKHIEVRYHHIQELIIDNKLEVWKVDTEVNIVNNLRKPLPDQCFNALKRHMGLQQASKQRRIERKAEGKSKNSTARQVKQTKSKEPISLKAEDAVECKWTKSRTTIHRKAREIACTKSWQLGGERSNKVLSY